jgi:hypothetical protein
LLPVVGADTNAIQEGIARKCEMEVTL